MSKVAVVTGGTRGMVYAISVELKNEGYLVAAIYGGNDAAAHKFQAETNIPIFKWDVGDYDACVAGLKQVEAQLGPISILVNNAGITRDAMLHRMTPQQWREVIRTLSRQRVQHGAARHQWNARPRIWADHQYFLRERPEGPDRAKQLLRGKGRDYRLLKGSGPGKREEGDNRKLRGPRLHQYRDGGRRP